MGNPLENFIAVRDGPMGIVRICRGCGWNTFRAHGAGRAAGFVLGNKQRGVALAHVKRCGSIRRELEAILNATHEGQDAADIIDAAAGVLKKRGKSDSGICDQAGRVCVWGALNVVEHGFPQTVDAPRRDISKAACHIRRFAGGNIPAWSNGNDQATVIAGLRAVAATLRAQQAAPVAAEPVAVSA